MTDRYIVVAVAAGVDNVLFNDPPAPGSYQARAMAGGGGGTPHGGYIPQWTRPPAKKPLGMGGAGLGGGGLGGGMRPRYTPARPTMPLQYCEVCKISCAGAQVITPLTLLQ